MHLSPSNTPTSPLRKCPGLSQEILHIKRIQRRIQFISPYSIPDFLYLSWRSHHMFPLQYVKNLTLRQSVALYGKRTVDCLDSVRLSQAQSVCLFKPDSISLYLCRNLGDKIDRQWTHCKRRDITVVFFPFHIPSSSDSADVLSVSPVKLRNGFEIRTF